MWIFRLWQYLIYESIKSIYLLFSYLFALKKSIKLNGTFIFLKPTLSLSSYFILFSLEKQAESRWSLMTCLTVGCVHCIWPCACVRVRVSVCMCVHVCMCVSVCVYGAFQWVTLNTHWLKSAWSCSSPLPLSSFLSPLVLHSHSSFSIYCFFMLIHSLSPHSVSLSLPTLLIFKVLWFVSLQTLMSSRGKISAGITSKHQHHLPSSSRSLLPPVLPAFTVLLHLKSCPLFIVCFSNTWFSLYSRFSHLFFNFLLFCASLSRLCLLLFKPFLFFYIFFPNSTWQMLWNIKHEAVFCFWTHLLRSSFSLFLIHSPHLIKRQWVLAGWHVQLLSLGLSHTGLWTGQWTSGNHSMHI